jgi:hypothetical protein
MTEIQDAEDFLQDYDQEYFAGEIYGSFAYMTSEVKQAMINFAKAHVKAALEAAYNNSIKMSATKDTILNSYPDTLIK